VSGEYESRRPVLSVKGIALIGSDGADPLREYMATLAGSPVVENVTMGSTRATEIEGRAARSFSMKLQLRSGSDLASVVEGE
jgi:Tfp pilus assembly protein PilN